MTDVLDLGALSAEGPLLVFGGPYSNLQATQALRQKACDLGIGPDRTICTGDVVAYCAQPQETVQLLRDWGCHVLMGNCEESLAQGSEDCGCGFEEGTACAVLSDQWFRYSMAHVPVEQREWMGGLPRQIRFEWAGLKFCVVHGSVSSINQFVFESASDRFFEEQLSLATADVVLGGHSGLPFTRQVSNGVWHNAGVIGMPANDGTPRTWFSLIRQGGHGVRFELQSLTYDNQEAARVMQSSGLSNGYARALGTGLWPSLDVLPEAEKRKTGRSLECSN